jgi:hypothetical protein
LQPLKPSTALKIFLFSSGLILLGLIHAFPHSNPSKEFSGSTDDAQLLMDFGFSGKVAGNRWDFEEGFGLLC